jgi:hypothetical protein
VKIIGPHKTYIDYFQGICRLQEGPTNRFGIRVREGLCLAVVKLGDRQVNGYGQELRLPVQAEMLPIHVRMIVYDHVLNYSASDLMDVVTGKTSFQQALGSPHKNEEPMRATANGAERIPDTSEQAYKGKSRR